MATTATQAQIDLPSDENPSLGQLIDQQLSANGLEPDSLASLAAPSSELIGRLDRDRTTGHDSSLALLRIENHYARQR